MAELFYNEPLSTYFSSFKTGVLEYEAGLAEELKLYALPCVLYSDEFFLMLQITVDLT